MQYVYEKEGILVLADVPKAEFGIYQHPKNIEDDLEVFPNVAWIPHAMLHKVDLINPIIVPYLQTINPVVETGVLFRKGVAGTPKRSKTSKKSYKV